MVMLLMVMLSSGAAVMRATGGENYIWALAVSGVQGEEVGDFEEVLEGAGGPGGDLGEMGLVLVGDDSGDGGEVVALVDVDFEIEAGD